MLRRGSERSFLRPAGFDSRVVCRASNADFSQALTERRFAPAHEWA